MLLATQKIQFLSFLSLFGLLQFISGELGGFYVLIFPLFSSSFIFFIRMDFRTLEILMIYNDNLQIYFYWYMAIS